MALGRGRLVGEAYVLMRADGTLMKADMVDAASNASRLAAGEGVKEFRKTWNEEFKRTRKSLNEGLAKDLSTMAGRKDFTKFARQFRTVEDAAENLRLELDLFEKHGLFSQTMRKDVEAGFKAWRKDFEQTERAARELAEENDRVARSFDTVFGQRQRQKMRRFLETVADSRMERDFGRLVDKGEDLEDALKRVRGELVKAKREGLLTEEQLKEIRGEVTLWAREQRKVTREIERQRIAEEERANANRIALIEERRDMSELVAAVRERTKAEDEHFAKRIRNLTTVDSRVALYRKREVARLAQQAKEEESLFVRRIRNLTVMESTAKRVFKDRIKIDLTPDTDLSRTLDKAAIKAVALNTVLDRTSFVMGRIVGRGARNDFINLFGTFASAPFRGVIGGIKLFTNGLSKLAEIADGEKLGSALSTLRAAFAPGGGGLLAGMRALPGIAKGLLGAFAGPQGLIAVLAAFAAATYGIVYILPTMVSLVSLLAGSMVSLLGAAIIGTSGLLLALGPLLVGAAAGFGLLGKAIYDFATKDKTGKKAIKDLNKELKSITSEVLPGIKKGFLTLIGGVESAAKAIAPALVKVVDDFNERLEDPRTQKAFQAWRKALEPIARNMGIAFNALGEGLTRFFVPILPYAERLSRIIRDAFENFSDWAGSAEGKNSIAEWMKVAWEAGKDLWGVLSGTAEALFKIFTIGSDQTGGGGLLDSLNGKLEELNGWLDQPENKDTLKEWFADAGRIAKDIGEIALNVGEFIGKLNSEEGRAGAKIFTNFIKDVSEFLTWVDSLIRKTKLAIGLQEALGLVLKGQVAEGVIKAKLAWDDYNLAEKNAMSESERHAAAVEANETRKREQIQATADLLKTTIGQGRLATEFEILVDDSQWARLRPIIENYAFTEKTIPVNGNKDLWEATKGTVAAYVFDPKAVAVEGQKSQWDTMRRQIEIYNFPPKKINVVAPSQSELYALKQAILAGIGDIRVNVGTFGASRDLTGGPTLGSGAVVYGPTSALIGEAGPEAVVPLNRPLNLVDPSVRALSAVAQGKQYAGGGVAGVGGVVVEPGAVVVTTRATSPSAVGSIVLSGIAEALASAY